MHDRPVDAGEGDAPGREVDVGRVTEVLSRRLRVFGALATRHEKRDEDRLLAFQDHGQRRSNLRSTAGFRAEVRPVQALVGAGYHAEIITVSRAAKGGVNRLIEGVGPGEDDRDNPVLGGSHRHGGTWS